MSKYDKITFAPPTRAETGDGLGRKMRDSCRACANSKVKCRREKPTCSRCAKRKVPCEYLPTKRGGRKSLRPRSPSLSDSAGGGNDDQIADHAARGRAASTSTAGSVTSAPAQKGESGVSSSITVASQLPSASLAGWFTPTESNHTATQAAPTAPTAAMDSDSMQHSAFMPGASVHHFSGLFAQTPHQPISSDAPASMASVPSEMGQYLDASLAFLDLDMDLDLDTCETDFLDMGQVDFHGNTAFTWGLEDMPLAPRSPSHDSDSHSGHGKASLANTELNTTMHENATLSSATAVNPKKDSEVVKSSLPEPHSCSCMVQALGLTKQLFPPRPRKSSGLSTPTKPSGLTIEAVMAQNDSIMEAATEMLECGCAEDDYLLFIMPLMVLKVLDWYAAAARPMSNPAALSLPSPSSSKAASPPPPAMAVAKASGPSSPRSGNAPSDATPLPTAEYTEQVIQGPSTVIIDGYLIDGEDSERMAAQLVLSKLHRAQRLVNQLSYKLKVQAEKKRKLQADASGAGDIPSSIMQDMDTSGGMRLPLSYSVLDELSVDLRRRLRRLSTEIVEQLRRHREY